MTLNELIAQLKITAKTKIEVFQGIARWAIGQDYVLGEEGYGYVAGTQQTTDPYDTDCSGYVYGVYRKASEVCQAMGLGVILWKTGATWPRLTANGYKESSTRVTDGKYRVGDVIVACESSGHAFHIALIVEQVNGIWYEIEARGRAYGVQRYTVDSFLKRYSRAYVHRFSWVNLGEVPATKLLKFGMSGADVKAMQLRLNEHIGKTLKGTGYFGNDTLAAVERFQMLKKLEIDGIVGPLTQAELAKSPTYPTLRSGSGGAYVRLLKWRLQKQGYGKTLHTDNDRFLAETEKVVRVYQKAKGFEVDGIVGPETWGGLRQ